MIFNVNSLNIKIMGSIDGEIPAVWFLITSVGFIILSSIQYKNHGKSIETIFFIYLGNLIFNQLFYLSFQSLIYPQYSQEFL